MNLTRRLLVHLFSGSAETRKKTVSSIRFRKIFNAEFQKRRKEEKEV
jgi:hypothetical protein